MILYTLHCSYYSACNEQHGNGRGYGFACNDVWGRPGGIGNGCMEGLGTPNGGGWSTGYGVQNGDGLCGTERMASLDVQAGDGASNGFPI